MKRIIGLGLGKPKTPPPNLDACIENVDKKAEALEKKVNQSEAELRKIREQMKKLGDGPAKNALKQKLVRILQRKKALDIQLDNVRQQSFNMEQVSSAVQSTKDAKVIVGAMKSGVSQMKKELKKVDMDEIQDFQDDLDETLEQSEEIQEALGRNYNMPDIDDDELQSELDALGDEIALDDDSSYLDNAAANAPNAPDRDIVSSPGSSNPPNGVAIDEFGLPKVHST